MLSSGTNKTLLAKTVVGWTLPAEDLRLALKIKESNPRSHPHNVRTLSSLEDACRQLLLSPFRTEQITVIFSKHAITFVHHTESSTLEQYNSVPITVLDHYDGFIWLFSSGYKRGQASIIFSGATPTLTDSNRPQSLWIYTFTSNISGIQGALLKDRRFNR